MLVVSKVDGVGEDDGVGAKVGVGVSVWVGDGFGVCTGGEEVGFIEVGCGVVGVA